MSMNRRYTTLVVLLLCFQALFFVPIMSAPSSILIAEQNNFSQMLLGMSPFSLHYQTLGLFPIVLAGISMTILPIVERSITPKMLAQYKDHLTYLFGFVMAVGIVWRSSLGLSDWQSYVSIFELMLSLQLIMMLINTAEKLEVASSPVMVFFAWNIAVGVLRDLYFTSQSALGLSWLVAAFGVCMAIFTLYVVHHFLVAKRDIRIAYINDFRGFHVADVIKKKAAQVSIMPVVVVSMSVGVMSSFWLSPQPGVFILSHPAMLALFSVALWFATRMFTRDKIKKGTWLSHVESMGGKLIVDGKNIEKDNGKAIDKWISKRVWEQWCFLMMLMVFADLANMWFISAGLAPVTYVAGLGLWLLVNAWLDMTKQYDKLRYVYL